MMQRGEWWILAMLSIMFLDAVCLVALLAVTVAFPSDQAQAVEFVSKPKDRPLLESPQKVWQARTTGVSEFDFDGMHYVIVNLPKEYVDYSSWYVRMP